MNQFKYHLIIRSN